MANIYTHPETGEQVEIPEGSEIEYGQGGEIRLWRNPPATPQGQLHPDQIPDYKPRFDRSSGHRRVLGAITDEVDYSPVGPRNSIPALAYFLARNADTPHVVPLSETELQLRGASDPDLANVTTAEQQVQGYLDELIKEGLVEQREDGSYAVTADGRTELVN